MNLSEAEFPQGGYADRGNQIKGVRTESLILWGGDPSIAKGEPVLRRGSAVNLSEAEFPQGGFADRGSQIKGVTQGFPKAN